MEADQQIHGGGFLDDFLYPSLEQMTLFGDPEVAKTGKKKSWEAEKRRETIGCGGNETASWRFPGYRPRTSRGDGFSGSDCPYRRQCSHKGNASTQDNGLTTISGRII